MKKSLRSLIAALAITTLVVGFTPTTTKADTSGKSYKSIGYFYQESGDLNAIDVTKITHLNYSFGLIYHNEENNEQKVPTDPSKLHTIYLPDKVKKDLKTIPELKKKNKDLKVLLSVGGWGCRGFSDAAATKEAREKFTNSAMQIVKEYGLDGIDIDWEYPVNGGWGVIKSVPEDKQNYTLLLQDLRNTIGKDKLLTIAGAANANFIKEWTDFSKIVSLLDYVNIMTYDYGYGSQYFNSNLYDSKEFPTIVGGDKYSTDFIVNNYLKAGLPAEKMNMGIAFYGRTPKIALEPAKDWDQGGKEVTKPYFTDYEKGIFKGLSIDLDADTFAQYKTIASKMLNNPIFTQKWDNDAKVPYLTMKDKTGKEVFALSYENEKSISIKMDYLKSKGLGGAMFWDYSCDSNNVLASQIAKDLNVKGIPYTPNTQTEVKPTEKGKLPATGMPFASSSLFFGLALAGAGVLVIAKRK